MKKAPKVKTNKTLIKKFLERGTDKIYPAPKKLEKKLLSGERMRIYQGFDPSGPYLHVGHAMGIRALRILQQLGHEVIFLVGDYTAKVGDPDKDTTRSMLTDEEIQKNMEGWKEQAGQLIDFSGENPVLFKRNYEWLSKLKMEDVIKLMSHITVQRMLERDLFERRIKENDPIRLHEFIYPLMQGYDGVAMEVDMEIGGSDQTFNMLVGRDLIKAYLGKEKFVRTNRMMDATDGRTMSKTKGNGINLSDSPQDMYGKAMAYSDAHILMGLEFLTDVSMEEIADIEKAMKKGENPMQFKKLMAFEIVRSIKGEKAAQEAQNSFEKVFSNRETPDDLPEEKVTMTSETTVLDALKESLEKDGTSASEIKRLVNQGAVKIDGKTIKDFNAKLALSKEGAVVKVGKRKWLRLKNK